jgi:hypothetical protein
MEVLVIFGLMTVFCMSSGAYIWISKPTHLLQNFPATPGLIRDQSGLARSSAIFLIIVGSVIMIVGLSIWTLSGTRYELLPLVIAFPCFYLMLVVFLVRTQRFIK